MVFFTRILLCERSCCKSKRKVRFVKHFYALVEMKKWNLKSKIYNKKNNKKLYCCLTEIYYFRFLFAPFWSFCEKILSLENVNWNYCRVTEICVTNPLPPTPRVNSPFPFICPIFLKHIFSAFKFNRRDPLEERADPRFGTPSLLTLVIQGEHGVLGMVGRTATIDPQGWVLS